MRDRKNAVFGELADKLLRVSVGFFVGYLELRADTFVNDLGKWRPAIGGIPNGGADSIQHEDGRVQC